MNELLRTILFLPPQSSSVARELDQLHYAVIIVTMLGAFGVAGLVGYFLLRYRRSARRGDPRPDTDPGHDTRGTPLWLELAGIGLLFTLFIAFWWVGVRQFAHLYQNPANAAPVYVVAKQWMWYFAYPNGGGSNETLYVPAGRPIKLVMTSRDVIHSFFVPHFRVKRDVLPGRVTTVWFEVTEPGEYPILCTEYCGLGHSTMRGRVVALSDAEYERTLTGLPSVRIEGPEYVEPAQAAEPGGARLSLAAMGEHVAAVHGCLRCHTLDGTPHVGPTWARLFGARVELEDGRSLIADEAYLTESMMDPTAKVERGFPPVMPSYQGVLGPAEAGALVELIRSLALAPPGPTSPLVPPGSPPVSLPAAPPPGAQP